MFLIILNNLFWQGIVEGDIVYYYSLYFILDEEAVFKGFIVIFKQYELFCFVEGFCDFEVLQWFFDGYYCVFEWGDIVLQYNDFCFGFFNQLFEKFFDFVFYFILEQDEDGEWYVCQGWEQFWDMDQVFSKLWNWMMGRKQMLLNKKLVVLFVFNKRGILFLKWVERIY